MNRIYRLVWNRALHVWQVASELTGQVHAGLSSGRCDSPLPSWPRRRLAIALAVAMPWISSSVYAACTPANPTAGATVTCTGAANILAPSYAATANNITVNVQSGASAGVLLGIGGTAMSLTGNNVTMNNAGTVDPSLLGLIGLLSSGTFIGNGNASTVTVNNAATGVMNGTSGLLGVSINGLTGMALAVQNGTGGVSNIRNDGTIGSNALLGISLIPSDAPVAAVYGGGQVNFVNTGTITGRVAFQANGTPGLGNSFANSGTINGGLSMGAGSTNTFTAVSGSSVNLAGGIGLDLNVLGLVGVTLGFAPTGVVDGGAGGNNTLVLQNVLPTSGTGTGTGGAVTTLSSGTYINFQHLTVNSGTWNLQGPLVSGDATLNGGLVNFSNGGVFGTNALAANGGAIAASTGGLTVANNATLGTGGLTGAGTNNFTLSGVLSGSGGLTQSGSGILTLTGANTYTGGTVVSAGTLALGGAGSLLATGSLNLSGATGRFDISAAAADTTLGSLTGVAGSQVALGAHNLTVGNATSTTFAGAVAGTGGVVKQGTGTWTLSGVNTYTGGTTINAGTLALSGAGALSANGAVTIGAASALDISGSSADQTIGNLIGVAGSQVMLGARTLTTGGAGNSTFAGLISGSGGLVKQGAGILTLSGANTYSGGTTINAGALQGDTTSLQGAIADNASLIFNQGANGTFAGVISGTGALTKQGAGVLTLSAANTYSGGTIISAGTLQGDTTSLQGNIANNAALVFNQGINGSFTGAISGTGSLNKQGAGTLTLSGTNTYTGGTTISAGTLQGTTASLTGAIVNNAALVFNQATNGSFVGGISGTGGLTKLGTGTVTLSGANSYSGGTTISAGALQGDTTSLQGNITDNASLIFGQAVDGTFAGIVSGTGSLTKQGAGTLTLSGANTYSGGTTISAGALQIATGNLTGNIVDNASLIFNQATDGNFAGAVSGTGSLTKAGAGTLTLSGANSYSGGTTISAGALQGDTGSLQGNMVDNAALIFTQGVDGTFVGAISGSGSLTKQGAGVLTLNGANSYTGGTTISAGTLQGDAASLQGNIADNAALVFNQAADGTYAGIISGGGTFNKTGAGTLTLSGANTYSGGTTISAGALQGDTTSLQGNITDNASLIFSQGADGTFAGVVSGTGSLTKSGAGVLTLSGANTYSGGTTISAGVLQGDTSSLQGNVTDNATLAFNQLTNGTFAGAISGTGALVKQGAGVLTLSGANSYSGGTTISAGTLQGDSTSLQGAIANNASLIFNQAADGSFTGAISGSGGLTKTGAGLLTLNGANSYSGGTTITAGTLQGDSNSLQGNILDNAALVFNQAANGSYAGVISGSGSLTKSGVGTLILGGANTYAGGTTISAGALQGDTASLQGNIVDNASLIFDQSANGNFAGVVSGSGSLVKQGAGVLTLSGANSYTGATQINAGTLALAAGSGLATSSGVNLSTGSTLDLSAAGNQTLGVLGGAAGTIDIGANTLTLNGAGNGSFGGVISGSGALDKQGSGTQTLTGANLYTGGTTITGGTLALGAGGSLAAGSAVTLGGTGTLDLSTAGNQTIADLNGASGQILLGGGSALTVNDGNFAGAISGNGGLVKTGAGALVLDGSNSYTGATQVTSGSLVIGSDAAHATAGVQSDVTVATTGSLGGFGHVDGNVEVQAGGHLAPGSVPTGSFTVNGNVTLDQGSQLDYAFGTPGANANTPGQSHNVQVNGNLSINGATLNPTDAGGFGPGLYNLFDYTGTLTETNGGITAPVGYSIQNLTGSKQINLINAVGLSLNIWNANGLASATQMGGGTGVWSQANPNWTDATGSITAVRAPADSFVIFGGAAGTVTVDNVGGAQPVTTQGIQFASNGYLLNGDALGLVAATPGALSEVRVGDGSAASAGWVATIDNVLTGNGLQKTGAGTLILNGANTYTQGTELSAGVLSVSSDANLGAASGNLDFEGGTLQVTGTAFTSTPRTIVFGAAGGGFDIADAGNTFTLNQALTGTGSLTKSGDGTLVLSGANSYSGGTTIGAGSLQGDSTSLQGNIADNGSLVFNQGANGSFAGVVSGSGDLVKQGAGTLTLGGANTYTGGTTISAGALQGDTTSIQGNVVDNASLILNQAGNGTLAGAISGTGSLTKQGAGTVTLSGANTYSGGTTISAGALQGDTTSIQGNVVDDASLILNQAGNGTLAGVISGTGSLTKQGAGTVTLTGANTYSGGTTISAGALEGDTTSLQGNIADNASLIFDQAANGTFAGVVSGTGSLTKDGAGTLTLSGANTYSGGTTINAGALEGNTTSIQGNVVDNATLIFDQTANGTYAGAISGTGDVLKQGAGTLTLSGVSSYTGSTGIDAGTLALGAGSSIASSSGVNLAAGSTLDVSAAGNQTIGVLNGGGGTVAIGGTTLTLDSAANGSFSGVISGSGAVIKDGTGTQTLTGANLYTGGTTINDGTLVLGAGGSLATGSALSLSGNGTLDVSAAGNQTVASVNGTGGQIQLGATTLGVGGGSFSGVIAGSGGVTKSGGGSLTLDGVNTYTGATLVSGGSLIIGGDAAHTSASVQSDITVANTGSLGGFGQVNGDVDVQSGGHLAPGNPVGSFTVNGNLLLEQGSQLDFSFGTPGANATIPGQGHSVQVNGDLTINGATLNPLDAGGFGPGLYNLFNYTGTLTEANGGITPPAGGYTIQNLTGSKQINLITTAGMELNFWNANGLATNSQMGGGSGVWSQANANWTDATGSVTSTREPANSFVIFGGAAGTVTVDDAAGGTQSVTTLGIQFASDGYHLNGDAIGLVGTPQSTLSEIRVGDGSAASKGWTATIDNVLTGAGFNKTGAGTLVLNGASTYTQSTELSAGVLSVSSDANLGAASANLDFEGGTLRITGTAFNSTARAVTLGAAGGGIDIADAGNAFTLSNALAGTGGLTKLGDGTLVLTGTNSYTGGTTISAGTLQGNSASLQGNIADNAALVFDQAANGTFTGSVSGSGSVTKQGAGTLVLSGANSYSGGTTISAGALQGDSISLQGNIVDNAALIVDQASDGTFAGAVSGSGSLTKQGAGMLTLSGANSYSGGTTISAGTLAGTTSSLQGDITDNATLAFNQTSDGTFAGVVSGSGSLIKQGAATLTLTGANTYSGGTTISAGTLQGDSGSLQGNIVDNATLTFDQATDGSFAGAISGAGAVVKQGAGVLTLAGVNSYQGGTQINAGTLQGDSSSLQGNIADNAALVFDQGADGSFAGVISGAGTVTKQGAGTLILSGANSYSGGTVISAGTLQGDSTSLGGNITDDAALVFNQSSDGAFNGSVSGSGSITKQGSANLTVNGSNPFAGTTTVQSGMLIVGDSSHPDATLGGDVVVHSGAMLGGVGMIGSLDLQGTVMPTSVTDPLNISGNAVLHSGSSYQVTANAAGQSSLIAAAGTVTIQGGTALAVLNPGNYKPTTEYTIITAGQGVSGTFASVQSSLTFLTPTLSYAANAVNLSLQRNSVSFVDIANTHNEKNTATGLDGLNFDNPVYSALTLLDPGTARRALDQLSGEVHASTQTALFDSSSHIRSAVNQHLQGVDYGGQTAQGETHEGVTVWTTGWGHWDDHDGDGNASHLQSNGSGLVVGADLPLDQTRLGVLIGRGQDSTRVDSLNSDTNTHSTYAGFYGNSEWDAFRLRGAVIYAWQDVRGHRSISFPGFSQSANSDYDAHTAQAYLEGSYVIPLGQFTTLEPYVNLARVQVHTDGFSEQGGAADLNVNAATANQTLGTLGLRGTTTLGESGLRGYAGIGWQHAWGDTMPNRNQRFVAGGPGFDIQGVAVASNAGVVDVGLRMPLGRNTWIDASYFGQFASHANDQSARLTLTVSF